MLYCKPINFYAVAYISPIFHTYECKTIKRKLLREPRLFYELDMNLFCPVPVKSVPMIVSPLFCTALKASFVKKIPSETPLEKSYVKPLKKPLEASIRENAL
jgi:hypothetical protein